jgi:transcriptional regulator with GAF, ATPase, and Fis domain
MGDGTQSPRTRSDPGFREHGKRSVRQPFLFLVIEAERPLVGGARFSLSGVDEILIGRGKQRQVTRTGQSGKLRLQVSVDCSFMSERHACIRRTPEGWMVVDAQSRNGTHLNGHRLQEATILDRGDVLTLGRTFFLLEHHDTDDDSDFDAEDVAGSPAGLLTLLPSHAAALSDLRAIARTRTAITLVGETGTGKEVISRAIHALSARRGPYVPINCGAIARTLVESELFGHVKGAFSGATGDRPGHIQEAHQGTLLLDEILAAPPDLQAALLRVIQEQQVLPVGARSARSVDVRFIAAAQRPLDDAVASHAFRADLQARLQGYVFKLPPLNERLVDMGILVAHTVRSQGIADGDALRLTVHATLRLLRYHWPRNIRELADALAAARHLAPGNTIDEGHLPEPVEPEDGHQLKGALIANLRRTKGNVAEAARRMGRNRTLIHKWLHRHEIDPAEFREAGADSEVSGPAKDRRGSR